MFTSLISRLNLWKRLKRSKEARADFVESHLNRSIAYQIRALREREKWTQDQFAQELGVDRNNVSARLENPQYGKHTLTTLKKVAKAGDMGLVVWFVPFSRMVDWATGTPHEDEGLRPSFYEVPDFNHDMLRPIPAETSKNDESQRLAGITDIEDGDLASADPWENMRANLGPSNENPQPALAGVMGD